MDNFNAILVEIKKLIEKRLDSFLVKEVYLDVAEIKPDSQNFLYLDLDGAPTELISGNYTFSADLALSYQLSLADYDEATIKSQFVKLSTILLDVVKNAKRFPEGSGYYLYDMQLTPYTVQANKQGYMANYPLTVTIQF